MEENLSNNKNILGIWTCWESNAFDGNDTAFQNQPGHDGTGRFIPYLHREGDSIALTPLVNYDKAGDGDYYLTAFNSGKEVVLEPFEYKIGDIMVAMTTIAVPIKSGDRVVGVVGVDIELSTLQSLVSDITLYETGYAEMISNQGVILAHPDEKLMGTDLYSNYSDATISEAISWGEALIFNEKADSTGADSVMAISPIQIGTTSTPWSLMIVIAQNEITEAAQKFPLVAESKPEKQENAPNFESQIVLEDLKTDKY